MKPRAPTFALLLAALLLAPLAVARAEDEKPRALSLEDVELLPVHEIEWAVVMHEQPDLVTRLTILGKRVERIAEHLKERADPQDAGSLWLAKQIRELGAAMAPDLERLQRVIEPLGIDADVLSVLDDAPRGPLRPERHAIRLVPRAPGLDARRAALLARLAPAVEGALLVLHDEDTKDAAQRSRSIQKRFWRVVDATLDRGQRIWVRRRLPTKVAKYTDFFGHLFVLPGLTPSQGTRLKTLLVRLEQEAAPDNAITTRLEAARKDEGLPLTKRHELEMQKRAADLRNVERVVYAWREGTTILTPDQIAELRSIPPLLAAKDRPGDLEALLKELDLRPEQKPALLALQRTYGPVKGRLVQRLAALAVKAEGYGPDTPQMEALQFEQAQAWADALGTARRAAAEIFRDLLTIDQIVRWVLAAP